MSVKSPMRLKDVIPRRVNCPLPAVAYDAERLVVSNALNAALYSGAPANDSAFTLNPNLRDVWLDTSSRFTLLYGGRGSSKSHDTAAMMVALAAHYKLRIVCIRQFQNKIADSVKALIEAKVAASPWADKFDIKSTTITHENGSEFLFYGIARNIDEIKSLEGVDILWLEEGQALNPEQWKVIEPTIRKSGSRIVFVWNPDDATDFIWTDFVQSPPQSATRRAINFEENPFLSKTMMRVIYEAYIRDPAEALHVYGGAPNTLGSKAVIPLKFIQAAIDAHVKLGWTDEECAASGDVLGFDLANGGGDNLAAVLRKGRVVRVIDEWKANQGQMMKSCRRARNLAARTGSAIMFDVCGMGQSIGEEFDRLNTESDTFVKAEGFNAGGGVFDRERVVKRFASGDLLAKDAFLNAKAEAWHELAQLFRNTYFAVVHGRKISPNECISIDSNVGRELIRKLSAELSAPMRQEQSGKFKVESKDDLKKRGVKSPNIADALVMSFAPSNLSKTYKTFFDFAG